jgi:hypothetical protein
MWLSCITPTRWLKRKKNTGKSSEVPAEKKVKARPIELMRSLQPVKVRARSKLKPYIPLLMVRI